MEGRTIPGSRRSGKGARPAPAPLLPEAALEKIDRHLKDREARRAELAERARLLRRRAQSAMTRLHAGAPTAREMTAIRREAGRLARWVSDRSPQDAGLAHDALQEAAEACLLDALARRVPLPTPEELGIGPEEYLLGLGDAVGELRRLVLADLAEGRLEEAQRRLSSLEELHRILLRFETTRAIVALKPKQDTARALLEKTRGEVTLARMLARAHWPANGTGGST
jgi:translin